MRNKKCSNCVQRLTLKQRRWLKCYTDPNSPETFGNATASAKAAKYRGKSLDSFETIGHENIKKLQFYLQKFLDEAGLSDTHLMNYLIQGLQAEETKFFAHEGKIISKRTVINWKARRDFLDMALKIKGLYKAEKHELSAPGGAIPVVNMPPKPATMEEWEQEWKKYQERKEREEATAQHEVS